jgi:general secretion pathway protein C
MFGAASGLSARLPFLRGARDGARGGYGPKIAVAALAGLCIWQGVRLGYALMVPVGPLGDWQPKSAEIMAASERASLFASFDPFFRSAAAGPEAVTVTSLGLTLFGINLNEATGGGSAIIAGEDGVQASYAVGDEIAAGVRLAGLAFDHVILERGGARESLFMDQSGGAEAVTPAAPVVSASPVAGGSSGAAAAPVAGVAANGEISPDALKKGLQFAPRMEGGKVTGLTVQPVGDGAIFLAAGLRDGDVVRAVNGRAIGSGADAAGMVSAIRGGARLSLEVERGASRVPIALFLAKS